MTHTEVSLGSLAGGGAAEQFQHELEKVLENIQDVNCDPTTKRQIVMTISIKPSEERDFAQVQVSFATKLAGIRGTGSTFYLGKKAGRQVALESNVKQLRLDLEEESNLREIGQEGEGAD